MAAAVCAGEAYDGEGYEARGYSRRAAEGAAGGGCRHGDSACDARLRMVVAAGPADVPVAVRRSVAVAGHLLGLQRHGAGMECGIQAEPLGEGGILLRGRQRLSEPPRVVCMEILHGGGLSDGDSNVH